MGVRGLTTFIANQSERYLTKIALRNTWLVIDGNCVASHLYKWHTKRDSAFGGDYDEYYVVVKNFFKLLKKCSITPIVVLDGGYEERKMKTVLLRLKTKLMTLKHTFSKGFSSIKFFPLFMLQVFCEVAISLNIKIIQCEFEADGEIAAISRNLQCPVLSYDSDFFIYDVSYIPFSTVELVAASDEYNNGLGLPCLIYKLDDFMKEHVGLKKCHLPILTTLLGNDYVNSGMFLKFFHQIPLAKSKGISNSDRRILGLIKWISNESEKTAIDKIKFHVGTTRFAEFLKAMDLCKANYSPISNCQINEINGEFVISSPPYSMIQNERLYQLLTACELPSFIINMITLRKSFLSLQVEDIQCTSSHHAALPVIQSICDILSSELGDLACVTLYMRQRGMIKEHQLTNISVPSWSMGHDARECMYKALRLDEEDQELVETLMTESQLFFASMISWCKHANPSAYHVHALLIGYLACQAKNRTGYMQIDKENELTVDNLVDITNCFAMYRKTAESAREYFQISVVHMFSTFQSILYHSSVLNRLLCKPFKPFQVSDFYSGTVLYNMFVAIDSKKDILKTLKMLVPSSKFYQVYERLYDRLCRYFPDIPNTSIECKRRRKKNKKKGPSYDLEDTPEISVNDEKQVIYEDISNRFHLLNVS